jgi:hypothetical protein
MKIRTHIRCFVVASVGALCGLLCWIEILSAALGESTPPFLLCCVLDGLLPSGFKLFGVFLCVL